MPKPGSYGVTPVRGWSGFLIKLGQFLYDHKGIRWQHAFIVLDDTWVMEARPSGAGRALLSSYPRAIFSDAAPLTDEQRAVVVQTALSLEGTPYGWWDYVSLALHRFHIRPKFVERRVNDRSHMICSQAVDYCNEAAGWDQFPQTATGDVTPGMLGYAIEHGFKN